MKYHSKSRRMFLQGAGSTALAIPFLSSLIPETAEAATVLPKYIHVNSSYCLPRQPTYPLYANPFPKYPQPAGTNPNSVAWIQKDANTKYQSLQEIIKFQGKVSWTLDEKWNPYASRMNLVTNAHAYVADNKFNSSVSSTASCNPKSPNGFPNANGPAAGCYSVDWLIEQALYRGTPAALIPTLRIHMYNKSYENAYQNFCFGLVGGKDAKLPMHNNLTELKNQLLGVSTGTTPQDNTSRRSIIDSVLQDYKGLMNHRRISAEDKRRLSNGVDLWNEVLKDSPTSQNCNAADFSTGVSGWTNMHKTAMKAVVAALSCGITRNVAYGLIQGGDNQDDMPGVADSRVPGAGDPAITDPYYGYLRWRTDLMAYFLGLLDSTLDSNGQPILNSSLLVWGHTTSNGNHGMLGHALVSVGDANGKLETGWHVDAGAAPVNKFHLTNMRAMGLSQSDIELNGRVGFGEYSPTTVAAAGGLVTSERDPKENRSYDMSKREFFFADVEKRRAFPYLK